MPKTGKKRSSKQEKGNLQGSTRAADIDQEVTTSNRESAREVMIREMRESG